MVFEKVDVAGVPITICKKEDVEEAVLELLAKPGTKQIVFLSVWNFLKARGKNDYAECVKNADLVLPISKSILWGAKVLKKNVPVRYNPFPFVIQTFSVLESHFKSIYLLGGHKKTLQKAEANVKATFPSLQLVGRFVGYYPKATEENVMQAIYKASPSLVLMSDGISEKDCWAYRRRNSFSSSIFLFYKDALGIFSERIKRVDEKMFNKGHEIIFEVIHNPIKVFLIFPFLWYVAIIVWYRLFKK